MNVLVTGGASGLGEAVTRKLAGDPEHRVYFTYSRSGVSAAKIEAEFSNTRAIRCDFKHGSDVEALREEVIHLDLDVLVNNAYPGSFLKGHFQKHGIEDFLAEFQENVLPTLAITQSVIAGFRKKKAGRIITILTSALVDAPPIGASIYAANKAYLQELVKVWATENSKFNIVSNSVSPSFMSTPFTSQVDERIVEQIRDSHPLKKLLTPEEAAEAVIFLCGAPIQINGIDMIINAATHIK